MGYLQPAAPLHGSRSHNAFSCLSKNLLSKLVIIDSSGKNESPNLSDERVLALVG
jgi:hypothetical protein